MTLESTILCVDNSEYMRNGDYMPTRGLAQQDAVNLICNSRMRINPENNLGLFSMADKQFMVTLTNNVSKIMNQLHQVTMTDKKIDFITSVKIAYLALKHRPGRNHKQKIIVFVGSPVELEEKDLIQLAKKLKKEKVNVDIISFGEIEGNKEKLSIFIDTLNGKEGSGSHIVTVPRATVLSEALLSSPIMAREDGTPMVPGGRIGGSGIPGGSNVDDFGFGLDADEMDPDLALALRVSLEEQRARQESERASAIAANDSIANTDTNTTATNVISNPGAVDGTHIGNPLLATQGLTEDEMALNLALAQSMGLDPSMFLQQQGANIDHGTGAFPSNSGQTGHELTEEEQIELALQMSLQPEEAMDVDNKSPEKKKDDNPRNGKQ